MAQSETVSFDKIQILFYIFAKKQLLLLYEYWIWDRSRIRIQVSSDKNILKYTTRY